MISLADSGRQKRNQLLKYASHSPKNLTRLRKNEKLPLVRPSIVGRMVKKVFWINVDKLVIVGDGTPVRIGANLSGNKVYDCKSKGIYNCHCPRRYSDPEAAWGWDSYRGCCLYGHHPYELTAASGTYNLPVV